jgi:hypothetical protein
LEEVKKIFLSKTLRIIVIFTQKIVIKLSKICVWVSGSKTLDPEKKPITDPGSRVKKAPDPGYGSPTLIQDNYINMISDRAVYPDTRRSALL